MELRLSNLYGIQYVYIIYVYIYEDVYKNIGRTCLVAPMLLLSRMRSGCIQLNMNVIRGLVKRAQLLWHVHNFCETCTTAGKRAQLLGNVHNISETCTYRILENTGWGGETRYTYIYIYTILNVYIYILHVYGHVYDSTYITVYTTLRYVTVMTLHYTTLHCIALHFHSIAYTNKHTCVHTYINYNIYICTLTHTFALGSQTSIEKKTWSISVPWRHAAVEAVPFDPARRCKSGHRGPVPFGDSLVLTSCSALFASSTPSGYVKNAWGSWMPRSTLTVPSSEYGCDGHPHIPCLDHGTYGYNII